MNDLLKFSVYASSVTDKDTSTSFPAENLLSDNPLDPTSRWSAGPNVSGDAWIIFELEKLSLIKGITFGKFHKPHPCNVKEFKISVGDTPHCSREMITSTLRNDSLPEHFNLPEEDPSGVQHPCLYLKISIRSTHGQNFSPSLWHISIRGQTDFTGAQLSSQELENLRQQRALLYVLKHLRQNNLQVSYRALLLETASSLEHPVVTALHHAIVQEADWKRAEELLYLAERKGLLDHGRLRMSWTDCPFSMVHPGPRSDSTICLDASQPLLYLYSGFSGSNLRDDLWLFNMNDYSWILLDDCVSQHGGPPYGGRRTMIADSTNGSLYLMTLGMNERLDDFKNLPLNYTDVSLASFFRFSTRGFSKGTWECLPTIIAPDFLSKSLLTAELRMDRVNGAIYMSAIVQDIGDREHIFIYSFDAECRGWRSLVSQKACRSHFT
ncbi:hypothetical protein SISSUDRAFT_608602 [Sistotremastrum suecicum HHB10207 ss-3]|uniref:Muskelin N-terminal domain-containing protein n=1 Tax=Sistotremastrum suecicum HHB10207 ss-3 TaxID=1314776 RepID=A0A166IBD5_9AGAM|nr:hypothetical protein SISSUDRAFT_608602 [Sistotremastrum suecicum HHB10207 ss-3]